MLRHLSLSFIGLLKFGSNNTTNGRGAFHMESTLHQLVGRYEAALKSALLLSPIISFSRA